LRINQISLKHACANYCVSKLRQKLAHALVNSCRGILVILVGWEQSLLGEEQNSLTWQMFIEVSNGLAQSGPARP